jgi:hypothetical protein
MNRYLICYQIGVKDQPGHIGGHCFVSMDLLTQSNIQAAMVETLETTRKEYPHLALPGFNITSVCKLDGL